MNRHLRTLAAYFGLGPDDAGHDAPEPVRLERVRPALVAGAGWILVLAGVSTALVLAVFDWELADVALWAAVGMAIWGMLHFSLEVRERVPRGPLVEPPSSAVVEPFESGAARRLLLGVPLAFGLAWLADQWDLGAVFVPGQFLGAAAANAVGAVLVARWERTHGRRVLVVSESRSADELYATP